MDGVWIVADARGGRYLELLEPEIFVDTDRLPVWVSRHVAVKVDHLRRPRGARRDQD